MDATIVPYTPRYLRTVSRFIRQQNRTHYHLDWYPVSTWLKTSDTLSLMAYDPPERLMGVLLLSAPVGGVAWLRLISLRNDAPNSLFYTMLSHAFTQCVEYGIQQVAALEIDSWINAYLVASGFQLIDHIIHLRRPSTDLPTPQSAIQIRSARRQDLELIEQVDQAGFTPHWQMRLADLEEVMGHTVWFTVALVDNQIVGYQASTAYSDAVHLTRLATLPAYQRQGVATALVVGLIHKFPKKDITVNTQQSNIISQHLYKRLGFQYQAWETPVWNIKDFL